MSLPASALAIADASQRGWPVVSCDEAFASLLRGRALGSRLGSHVAELQHTPLQRAHVQDACFKLELAVHCRMLSVPLHTAAAVRVDASSRYSSEVFDACCLEDEDEGPVGALRRLDSHHTPPQLVACTFSSFALHAPAAARSHSTPVPPKMSSPFVRCPQQQPPPRASQQAAMHMLAQQLVGSTQGGLGFDALHTRRGSANSAQADDAAAPPEVCSPQSRDTSHCSLRTPSPESTRRGVHSGSGGLRPGQRPSDQASDCSASADSASRRGSCGAAALASWAPADRRHALGRLQSVRPSSAPELAAPGDAPLDVTSHRLAALEHIQEGVTICTYAAPAPPAPRSFARTAAPPCGASVAHASDLYGSPGARGPPAPAPPALTTVFVNAGFQRLTGYAAAELLAGGGVQLAAVLDGSSDGCRAASVLDALAGGDATFSLLLRLRHKDGSRFWCDVRGVVADSDVGAMVRHWVGGRDKGADGLGSGEALGPRG